MSEVDFDGPDEIDTGVLRQVDAICSEFDRNWQAGFAPRMEDYIPRLPVPGMSVGFTDLLGIEIEWRRAAGEKPTAAEYVDRFPEFASLVRKFFSWDEPTVNSPVPPIPDSEAGQKSIDGIPKQLGGFRIERRLGGGAFGVVYLAQDPDLPRYVALKVPRSTRILTPEQRQAFVRDAEFASQLNHPGVVTIHGIQTIDDIPIIIQEFLPGGDLKDRLKAADFDFKQVVAWMIPIAEAIAAAHQKNIYHRDLKPANILLDEHGNPRVADFGLALHEQELWDHRDELAGTYAYMSPEQVRRETNRLDGRSDIWSLGVIFYEMLTGKRPFVGSTEQIIEQIKLREPRPPRQLNPAIPEELQRICVKCLEKRVARRYATARDFSEDLAKWQRDTQRRSDRIRSKPNRGALVATGASPAEKLPRVVPKGLRSFDSRDSEFFL
ncbi:MAG: serine/threonine protein kinase, partial [Planctomycetes bacterium]|nr:serine/threonine protein kinase [Planctomycetota bacterium]